MAQTYQELSAIFNNTITNWQDACGLIDVIKSDNANGRYVPPLSEEIQKNLTLIYNFGSFDVGTDAVRVTTEAFFREILGYFDDINAGNTPLKWISYSGHDSNVGPTLIALNFTSQQCVLNEFYNLGQPESLNCASGPIFASSIIIEVHDSDSDSDSQETVISEPAYVRVRYNGVYMNLCEKNSTFCDYQEFTTRISNTFAPTFEQRCGADLPTIQVFSSFAKTESVFGYSNSSIFLMTLVIGQACAIFFILKKNKNLKETIEKQEKHLIVPLIV